MEKEILFQNDLEILIGKRPFDLDKAKDNESKNIDERTEDMSSENK